MIGQVVAAGGLTVWAGAAMLRGLVGEPTYHLFIQRTLLTRAEAGADLVRDHSIANAMADYLVHGESDPRVTWERYGIDESYLPPQTERHLKDVRRLMTQSRWTGLGASILATTLIAGRFVPASTTLKLGGRIAAAIGAGGVATAAFAFPRLWSQYHEVAYQSRDWELHPDEVLAKLYPEDFYRRAAIGWFGGWAVLGLILDLLGRIAGLRDRRLPIVNEP